MIEEKSVVPNDLQVRATSDALRALRRKHGAGGLIGRRCTTILSQLRSLPTYVRPAWATRESQTLQGQIKFQMAKLEAALRSLVDRR